jgi:uncharacterized membrane protein
VLPTGQGVPCFFGKAIECAISLCRIGNLVLLFLAVVRNRFLPTPSSQSPHWAVPILRGILTGLLSNAILYFAIQATIKETVDEFKIRWSDQMSNKKNETEGS